MKYKFLEIVGQEKVKSRFNHYLCCHEEGATVPNIALVAPKGTGKTLVAKRLGAAIQEASGGDRPCHLVDCSLLKNVRQFITYVIIKHFTDKKATVIMDEAHNLKTDIAECLLTLTAPNEHKRNETNFDDQIIEMDFHRHSFIFATTDAQKMRPALLDRCTRIELEEYSLDDVGQIIKKVVNNVSDPALECAASVCRGNARAAVLMGEELERYIQRTDKRQFTLTDWAVLKQTLGLNNLGLSNMEVQILRILKDRPTGATLTRLAACLGASKEIIQRDLELYLQKMGLIEITTGGRVITGKGLDYLRTL